MTTVHYRGFSIQSRPYQNHQSRQWTVDLEIHRNGRGKPFSLDERYATEAEADARCLSLGRRIIDGSIGGWSVDSLRPTGFLSGFSDGAMYRLTGTGRTLINVGILMVIAIGAIMLLRSAYLTH